MQFWKKSTEELKQLDCFKSIDDLSIKIWFDIHKTGDYRLLMKKIITINESDFERLFKVWEGLYNEYMDRFGLSEEFKDNLRLQVEIANLKARLVITGQRHLRTQIKIKEEEFLANSPSDKPPVELETLLAKMSKYYGFKLESKELTVTQYYSYLNTVKNG
jgi:hypothetical protein